MRQSWPYLDISNLISCHLWFFPKGLAYDFGSKFQISCNFVCGQNGLGNDVWWCFWVATSSSRPYLEMSNCDGRHFGFFPKGLPYDFGSKFQINCNFVCGQNGLGNDVWWCFWIVASSSRPYMEMSNCDGRHLGLFLKGLAYDFGSKFQISSKFVYGQFGPRNNVCWGFRVKFKQFWRYLKMSSFISRHLRFFPKGLTYDFRSKLQISLKFVHGQIGPGNDVWWCS